MFRITSLTRDACILITNTKTPSPVKKKWDDFFTSDPKCVLPELLFGHNIQFNFCHFIGKATQNSPV